MVEDGQNDFVHVLPQAQVDLLLLLQGVHQLRDRQGEERGARGRRRSGVTPVRVETRLAGGGLTSSLEALSISAARH